MIKVVFSVIVFCILSGFVKNEEKKASDDSQNLHQHIQTEIIDLPDDNTVGRVVPYTAYNREAVYPWSANDKIYENRYQLNYPSAYPDPYYTNTQYAPQQPQYLNYPYVYRPFFPSSYVYRNYPSLYHDFPNGFYVLPDTQNIVDTSKTTTTDNVGQRRNNTNVSDIQSNIRGTTDRPQGTNYHISNYTKIGEKKTFVNHVELKPVSTKLTRFGGPDGKMYVKVVSSDNDGEAKITESEYTGNIDLKITNGVLESPNNNSSDSIKSILDEKTDPNSIVPEIDTRTVINDRETEDEKEEEENDRPLDITSWLG